MGNWIYVNCKCCGEYIPQIKERCPVCGAINVQYVDEQCISNSDTKVENIECPCCGEKYPITQENCPMCRSDNPLYGEDMEEPVVESNAVLIDEESDDNTPKTKKSVEKQKTPDNSMVLVAYVGIILIVIILALKAIFGVADRAGSKIGFEIFESQDYNQRQNSQ